MELNGKLPVEVAAGVVVAVVVVSASRRVAGVVASVVWSVDSVGEVSAVSVVSVVVASSTLGGVASLTNSD